MAEATDRQREHQPHDTNRPDDQGSAGQSGQLDADKLRDERDTPDNKGRAIEHGAEQYYRNNAPDDGPLDPGDKPEAPGKVPRGRSAT